MFPILSLLFLAAAGFANMSQIFDLEEIEKELDMADANTLVVFDVDDVLITTEDQFVHPYAWETFGRIALQYASKNKDKTEQEDIHSLFFLLPKRILIEESTPSLIKRLQDRGIKTIALTACQTGKLGRIPSVETWRIDDLKSLGIDFSASFPNHTRIVFDELTSAKHPSPLYDQGILFSYGYKKGAVLKAFLDRIDFHPDKIVFIDDLTENLHSVGNAMKEDEISHHVFHYTGAARHYKELDSALIEYQFHHLVHHKEWLSDAEAKSRLEKKD